MNIQDEHAFSSGEIEQGEHPVHCICTGCTLEKLMERDGVYGRYDSHPCIAPHLSKSMELRLKIQQQVPRSTGGGGYKRAGVAGVAEERTVGPSPTVDKDAA